MLKYKKLISILFLFLVIFYNFNSNILAEEKNNKNIEKKSNSLNINAKAAVLMEPSTGKIILEKNCNKKLSPASVTKIMTMLLIYDAIKEEKISWEDIVTISENASNMGGSQVFLEPGEQQTVRDLTKSIVIASANDAAVAMAEYLGGSEESFVQTMNKKAKDLGMLNTNFVNACGLDEEGHITTAKDIAIMSRELINKHPEVLQLTNIWMDKIVHKTSRGDEEFTLSNTNKMLKIYKGALGLKTGSTSKALFCISSVAKRNNLTLISVILGAPSSNIRFDEAKKLLDYGFANYKTVPGEKAGTIKGSVEVYKGKESKVNAIVKNQINVLSLKGNNIKLENKVELLDNINAPIKKHIKVGEIVYICNDKEVGRSDLVSEKSIDRANLAQMLKRLLFKWFK